MLVTEQIASRSGLMHIEKQILLLRTENIFPPKRKKYSHEGEKTKGLNGRNGAFARCKDSACSVYTLFLQAVKAVVAPYNI